MKQTILAITISAVFCYSSYALSEGLSAEDALSILEGDGADVVAYCRDAGAADLDITVGECISLVYRGAASTLIGAAFELGKKEAECATKSRELYTF